MPINAYIPQLDAQEPICYINFEFIKTVMEK